MCVPHRVTPTPRGAHSLLYYSLQTSTRQSTSQQDYHTWLTELTAGTNRKSTDKQKKQCIFRENKRCFVQQSWGLYPPLDNRESRSAGVFTQTCHFTVCGLRYFKLESSHFLEKEQGIIYRVHLLFPNVKYLKFSLRERYAKSCVLLSNQSIFSFQAPTKKIVNEDFHGAYFTSRTSRWASIKGTRKTNEKRERLFCKNTLFIAHEAVTLQ